MADVHSSNEQFFDRLSQLIEQAQQKGHGSIFLTQKRLSHMQQQHRPTLQRVDSVDHMDDLKLSSPLPLLVRATDGKSQSTDRKKNTDKIKLSTVVQPDDIESFFSKYAEVCRASMQSLRKRDRSKRKGRKKKDKKQDSGEAAAP